MTRRPRAGIVGLLLEEAPHVAAVWVEHATIIGLRKLGARKPPDMSEGVFEASPFQIYPNGRLGSRAGL